MNPPRLPNSARQAEAFFCAQHTYSKIGRHFTLDVEGDRRVSRPLDYIHSVAHYFYATATVPLTGFEPAYNTCFVGKRASVAQQGRGKSGSRTHKSRRIARLAVGAARQNASLSRGAPGNRTLIPRVCNPCPFLMIARQSGRWEGRTPKAVTLDCFLDSCRRRLSA